MIRAERVKRARQLCRMRQADLAEKVGWNRANIARLEMGYHPNMRADGLVKFCKALGCSADYLLGLSNWYNEKLGWSHANIAGMRAAGAAPAVPNARCAEPKLAMPHETEAGLDEHAEPEPRFVLPHDLEPLV